MARGRRRGVWKGAGVALLVGACGAGAGVGAAGANRSPQSGDVLPTTVRTVTGTAGTIRANATMSQRVLRADGQPARVHGTPASFGLDRRQLGGKWRTTITFANEVQPIVRNGTSLVPITNPFAIARVEFDEDTADTRAYDQRGRRLALPTDTDRRRFGVTDSQRGPGWDPRLFNGASPDVLPQAAGAGGFYAETAHRDRRGADLRQRYGRAVGRVRGLDRYLATDGSDTREVLVSPDTNLPVEMNLVRSGVLTSRVQLTYVRAGSSGYVRQSLHAERIAGPASPGDLVVFDLLFTDIEVATRGGR